jgi:hypothetical protein
MPPTSLTLPNGKSKAPLSLPTHAADIETPRAPHSAAKAHLVSTTVSEFRHQAIELLDRDSRCGGTLISVSLQHTFCSEMLSIPHPNP